MNVARTDLARLLATVSVSGHGLALLACALVRRVDGDEGFYAAAVGLVADGQAPYSDFFYPQAPLMPYVYAPALLVGDPSIVTLRLVSVALGTATAFLVSRYLRSVLPHHPWAVLLGIIWYCANPYVLAWHSVVKTYPLASLLFVGGVIAGESVSNASSSRWRVPLAFLAGCLPALAASTRLLYLPVALVFVGCTALGQVRASARGMWLRGKVGLAVGLFFGLAPIAWHLTLHREQTEFGLVGYHTIRSLSPDWSNRAAYLATFLWSVTRTAPLTVAGLVFSALGVAGVLKRCVVGGSSRSSVLAVAVSTLTLTLACLVPYPLHSQYLNVSLAPTLALLGAFGYATLLGRQPIPSWRVTAASLAGMFLSATTLVREQLDNSKSEAWTLRSFRSVCAEVRRVSKPGERVLSLWPGYVFETKTQYFPGLENHFAMRVTRRMESRQRLLRLPNVQELVSAIVKHEVRVVVFGPWVKDYQRVVDEPEQRRVSRSLKGHYRLENDVDGVKIFTLRDSARSKPRARPPSIP